MFLCVFNVRHPELCWWLRHHSILDWFDFDLLTGNGNRSPVNSGSGNRALVYAMYSWLYSTCSRLYVCMCCCCSAVKRLRSHMRCHGEKTFACDLCMKKFTMRAQLVRHQLVHSGVKAFVCPYCTYRSAIVENLRKHCHAVHRVLYPPKKRDVARGDDLATAGCTTVPGQGCSTSVDCTTSTVEGCGTVASVAVSLS